MKNLLTNAAFAIALLCASCSVESVEEIIPHANNTDSTHSVNFTCADVNPQAEFTNNGTVAFNFRVYYIDGTFISEDLNVMPGTTTSWSIFTAGDILFNVESNSSGISDQKVIYTMNNCSEISLVVDASNELMDTTPVEL